MKPSDPRLDPQIREFVDKITADYARHPPMDTASVDEKRRIASSVRAPWAQGGPKMARTSEVSVPLASGAVRLRLHYPSLEPNLPVLLYAHGGGWVFFDLDTHDRVMREYAARAGVVVAGIDYSRAPEARYPKALNEMVGTVRWLRDSATALGIDPKRIAVGGDSAGGNLTLCACLRLRDSGDPDIVRGMLLNYGAFDINVDTESHRRYGGGDYVLATDEMLYFWSTYLGSLDIAQDPYACPINGDLAGLPPAFLAVAELDVLHDGNLRLAEKLERAGVPVSCTVYPGTVHGFIEAVEVAQVTDRAFEDTARWLRDTVFNHRS